MYSLYLKVACLFLFLGIDSTAIAVTIDLETDTIAVKTIDDSGHRLCWLSLAGKYNCINQDGKVIETDYSNNGINKTKLITASGDRACLVDTLDTIDCFQARHTKELPTKLRQKTYYRKQNSRFKNIKKIIMPLNKGFACFLLEGNKAGCWNFDNHDEPSTTAESNFLGRTLFEDVTHLVTDFNIACSLGESKPLNCWSHKSFFNVTPPKNNFKNISEIAIDANNVCVVDENATYCSKYIDGDKNLYNRLTFKKAAPPFKNLKIIAAKGLIKIEGEEITLYDDLTNLSIFCGEEDDYVRCYLNGELFLVETKFLGQLEDYYFFNYFYPRVCIVNKNQEVTCNIPSNKGFCQECANKPLDLKHHVDKSKELLELHLNNPSSKSIGNGCFLNDKIISCLRLDHSANHYSPAYFKKPPRNIGTISSLFYYDYGQGVCFSSNNESSCFKKSGRLIPVSAKDFDYVTDKLDELSKKAPIKVTIPYLKSATGFEPKYQQKQERVSQLKKSVARTREFVSAQFDDLPRFYYELLKITLDSYDHLIDQDANLLVYPDYNDQEYQLNSSILFYWNNSFNTILSQIDSPRVVENIKKNKVDENYVDKTSNLIDRAQSQQPHINFNPYLDFLINLHMDYLKLFIDFTQIENKEFNEYLKALVELSKSFKHQNKLNPVAWKKVKNLRQERNKTFEKYLMEASEYALNVQLILSSYEKMRELLESQYPHYD